MGKMRQISAIWVFVLIVIAPGVAVMAGDPPATQDKTIRGTNTPSAPAPPALRQALASALGVPMASGTKAIPSPPAR
jgi:hypothetical protein